MSVTLKMVSIREYYYHKEIGRKVPLAFCWWKGQIWTVNNDMEGNQENYNLEITLQKYSRDTKTILMSKSFLPSCHLFIPNMRTLCIHGILAINTIIKAIKFAICTATYSFGVESSASKYLVCLSAKSCFWDNQLTVRPPQR